MTTEGSKVPAQLGIGGVIGSDSFLHTILKKLEVDYGWSFYDENKKLLLSDMQRELIQDVAKVTKELFS